MTLKIERNSDGRRTLIRLIGRVRSEHLEELKKQTGVKGPPTQRSGSLREGHVQAAPRLNDSKMKCGRCLSGEEATYRVYSDALDMAVCAACADEARKLGIGVEPLSQE
jgi:hypothetical protein